MSPFTKEKLWGFQKAKKKPPEVSWGEGDVRRSFLSLAQTTLMLHDLKKEFCEFLERALTESGESRPYETG